MSSQVLIWKEVEWKDIPNQDWPDTPGTVFITKQMNGKPGWRVSKWVDDPDENVLGLGEFWDFNLAHTFANVVAEQELTPSGGKNVD